MMKFMNQEATKDWYDSLNKSWSEDCKKLFLLMINEEHHGTVNRATALRLLEQYNLTVSELDISSLLRFF